MQAIKALLVSVVVAAALLCSSARAESVQAVPSDSFVDFLGIQGHLDWKGTIWETAAPALRARLAELGIRHMRTAIGTSTFARDQAAILFREQGVRLSVIVEPKKADGALNPTRIGPIVNFLRDQIGVEKISSIEGANEYSWSKYKFGNAGWVAELRDFQNRLYAAVKADSELNSVPVAGPTIFRRIVTDYEELGDLGAATDFGNLHYYNSGRKPSIYKLERYFGDVVGIESPMDLAIQNSRITAPGKPVLVTETGFKVGRLNPPPSAEVSERTAAKYLLRLMGEFFIRRADVPKAYIFALIDEYSIEKQFGLLRRDLSRRPAFYAIKNAVRTLSDKGPSFSPGTLTFSLTGDLSNIHYVVLQKRDGRFYLMIWNDAVSWDRMTQLDIEPPLRRLTLDVSQHRFRILNSYSPTALGFADPNHGALPSRTVNAPRSVVLLIPDCVRIIELIP